MLDLNNYFVRSAGITQVDTLVAATLKTFERDMPMFLQEIPDQDFEIVMGERGGSCTRAFGLNFISFQVLYSV